MPRYGHGWVVCDGAISGFATSASQMGPLETTWLGRPKNLGALPICPANGSTRCTAATAEDHRARHGFERSRTYSEREGTAYNGRFGCTYYRPLVVFNQFGDVERCARPATTCTAPTATRAVAGAGSRRPRGTVMRPIFAATRLSRIPKMYKFLETKGLGFVIQLPTNRVLQDKIGYLLKRPNTPKRVSLGSQPLGNQGMSVCAVSL